MNEREKHYDGLLRAAAVEIERLRFELAETAKGPMGELYTPGLLAERLERADTQAALGHLGYGAVDHGGVSLWDLEPVLRLCGLLTTPGVYRLLRVITTMLPLPAKGQPIDATEADFLR